MCFISLIDILFSIETQKVSSFLGPDILAIPDFEAEAKEERMLEVSSSSSSSSSSSRRVEVGEQ